MIAHLLVAITITIIFTITIMLTVKIIDIIIVGIIIYPGILLRLVIHWIVLKTHGWEPLLYVPTGQASQFVDPALSEYVFSKQGVQFWLPKLLLVNVPGGHLEHCNSADDLNQPGAHGIQINFAINKIFPFESRIKISVPSGQSEQVK